MNIARLAAAAAILPLSAAALSPEPAGRWTVRTHGEGDSVALSASNGVMRVDWSILPRTQRINGCHRYRGGWADLVLDRPVALADDDERIVFELRTGRRVAGADVFLFPVVVDGDGETFVYAYGDMPQLKGADDAWRLVCTPSFYAGEAGAASQDVFELDGDGVDFTPNGRAGGVLRAVPSGGRDRRRPASRTPHRLLRRMTLRRAII